MNDEQSLLEWLGTFLSTQTGLPTALENYAQLADGVALCDACKALSGASVGTVWRACPTPACCTQNATLAVRCLREKLAFPGPLEPQDIVGGNQEKLAAVVAHLRTLAMRERSTGATAAATTPGTGPSRGTGAQEGAAPTLLLPPPSLPFPVAPLVPPARPSGAAPAPAEPARPDEGSDAADTLPPLEGHTPRSLAQDTPDSSGQCLSGGLGKATPPHCSAEADATAFRSIGSPRSADLCSVAVTTLSGDFGAGVVSPTAPREMTLLGGLPERVGAPPCQAAPGPPPRGQPQQPQQQPQQQQQQNLRPAVNRMQTPQQRVTQPLTPPPTPQQPMPPPLMGQGMNPMMMGTPMGAPMNPAMMMGMNPMMLAMGQGNAMFPQMNPMMMGMQQGPGLDPAMNPLMMGMGTGGMPQPMMPMNMMAAPAPGRGVSLAAAPLGRPAPLQTAKRPAACLSSVQFPDSYLPAESRRCVRCAQSSCEAYLMYVDENYSLQQFHMTGGAKEITIGRHSSCTLCLCRRDQTMSRMHAAVKCVRNSDVGHTTSFVIRDTSTGGTAVNTDKVSKPRELRDGDHVFLGQCPVSLFFFRPNTCDNPAFEGILGIPGTGLTKKWIPRHCCITQDVLLLFKKKNDPFPVALVELCGAKVKVPDFSPGYVELVSRNQTHTYQCDSPQIAELWVKALKAAISASHTNPLKTPFFVTEQGATRFG